VKDFLRLLRLFEGSWRWVLAGIGLTVLVILANVGLLALSGWFIAAMALAGLGALRIEYFLPAAAIRGLAVIRTGGRYLERLISHEATFRLLARLRVWFYEHLEPLAPAGCNIIEAAICSAASAPISTVSTMSISACSPQVRRPSSPSY
jgi:ATP-binding cassette, subfamily C, bacterial CydC